MTSLGSDYPSYEAITASAVGGVHSDVGRLGEDSHEVSVGWAAGAPKAVMAVADGHGAAAHFRSRVGAECAVSALLDAAAGDGDACGLASGVVEGWRSRVADDLARNPVCDREIAALSYSDQVDSRLSPVKAYGSTLLGAIIHGRQLTLLQIGDGDLLFAFRGSELELAFPGAARALGDATHSLCMERSAQSVLVRTVECEAAPVLVAAATDGVRNSLTDPEGLEAFFEGLLRRSVALGAAGVRSVLSELVNRCASQGAGDDATVVALIRSDVFVSATTGKPNLGRVALVDHEVFECPQSEQHPRRPLRWLSGGWSRS